MRLSIPCWTHIVMLSWVCTDSAVLNSVIPALLQWWCACRTQKSNEIKIACWCVCTTHRMMIACERTVNTRPDNNKSNDLGVWMHQKLVQHQLERYFEMPFHALSFRTQCFVVIRASVLIYVPHTTFDRGMKSATVLPRQWVASESPVSRQWVAIMVSTHAPLIRLVL